MVSGQIQGTTDVHQPADATEKVTSIPDRSIDPSAGLDLLSESESSGYAATRGFRARPESFKLVKSNADADSVGSSSDPASLSSTDFRHCFRPLLAPKSR